VSIPLPNGTVWQPHNSEGGGYGTISLESATVNSVNVAYANLEVQLGGGDAFGGAPKIVDTAKRMRIRCCPRTTEPSTPLVAVPAAVLGANEVSPLEMATAYGTLAFGGQHVQPTPVIRITGPTGTSLYELPKPKLVVNPSVISVADGILQKVVQYGTGTAANIGRPQIGKTGTEDLYRDAWFIGAIPQLVAAVWVGFPQGQISMAPPTTRITVFGGTWPAQIWHAFMAVATAHMPVKEFPTGPAAEYVTQHVDITQGCLANPFTPPSHVKTFQYIAGTEPNLKVCKEPSSYQTLTVPSVVGLTKDAATTALHNAGFNVSVVFEVAADQPEGTVLSQDPSGGSQLLQTATVTITVAKGSPSPSPSLATVPGVVGLTRGAASAALQRAGFVVSVVLQRECNPADPACTYRQGIVWSQSPSGGRRAEMGSAVTITVNP
jgi:penicillin-binding protein 1A